MATERTPAHKRIRRAEEGRDDWKVKAIERREEIEKLKRELALSNANLEKAKEKLAEYQENIGQLTNKLAEREEALKKKAF